jgi:hypothetical protein
MAKKFTNSDPYAASTDQLWAMLGSRDYWEQKYQTMGATEVEFQEFTPSADAVSLKTVRSVPADLPGFAKKIIGETNRVTQTENWRRAGDTLSCDIDIAVKNVPGGTTGTMQIKPTGAGCQWDANFDIKVPLPIVGGKLEGLMVDETTANFKQEKVFNDSWLASH